MQPGSSIAHYSVVSRIGAGGMGEVYRAHDTKLGRDVAVKVLPAAFAQDPERLARFEREARTLAQLQHPHIASIYGFERTDGGHCLVMELAVGQDLAQRLKAGPVPVREALEIARRIAMGLEAAHEKGIIHRDLKPANVMLGDDLQVKILDFGLARAFEEAPIGQNPEHSPTLTAAMTGAGVILGTAAYMSPEQARGRQVDHRTDIWALGVVLFEMLSGKQAFPGTVTSEIIAKVLEREPDWSALPAELHPLLRRLLQRCLQKDPKARLHAAADVRLEIEEIQADPDGMRSRAVVGGPPARTSMVRRLAPWLVTAALAASLVVALRPRRSPPDPMVQIEVTAPPGAELGEFSIAPDGSALAFVAVDRNGTRHLWLRTLAATERRLLPGTEGAQFPFWSPDARSIAFFAGGRLLRLDLASLSVQTIAPAPNGRGGAWSADGTILFTPAGEDVLYTVPATGGTPTAVTRLGDGESTHRFPHFLPDGRSFTFCGHTPDDRVTRRWLGRLGSTELVALPDGMSETYMPPGRALFVREGTLVAQAFDAGSGRLTGSPAPLATEVSDIFPRTGRSSFSVSNNGVLAVFQEFRTESRLVWYDRAGRELEAISRAGYYVSPSISPDLTKVSFERTDPGSGTTGISVMDLARGSVQQLPASDVSQASAVWDSEGRSLIYGVMGNILLRLELAGGAPDTVFVAGRHRDIGGLSSLRDLQVAADNSFILFTSWDSETDWDTWRLDLGGDDRPRRLQKKPRVQDLPRISPDMRWVAYQSDESGRYEVYIRPTAPSERQWLVSTAGGASPFWSADGRELFYLSPDDRLMAVAMGGGRADEPGAGLPAPLFRCPGGVRPNSDGITATPVMVAVDGDRFLFNVAQDDGRRPTIRIVVNWEQLLTAAR
jgi:Tol biopolymer transport system component